MRSRNMKNEKTTKNTAKCANCGKEIIVKRPWKRFCSDECRKEWWRKLWFGKGTFYKRLELKIDELIRLLKKFLEEEKGG